ncbi:c-type cytochrome [Cupriavidus lacunae]|nr:c-type cytochrome [Cupriavidus lacunae]
MTGHYPPNPRGSRLRLGLLALIAVSGVCHAQSAVTAGDPALSTPAPSLASCVSCHGVLGAGTATGGPRLAGMNPDYLAHALSMFKAGTRASAVMQSVAHDLSDSEIRSLAVFFSAQHPPRVEGAHRPLPAMVIAGKRLAELGAAPDVPACFTCHAADGKGSGARYPGIAGEPAAFVISRLHAFQARAKAGTPVPGTMTAVAATLDERQIEEAAAYLSVIDP